MNNMIFSIHHGATHDPERWETMDDAKNLILIHLCSKQMGSNVSAPAGRNKAVMRQRRASREKKVKENIERMDRNLESRDIASFTEMNIRVTARRQMERGDRPFTKDDLVAILLRLRPSCAPQVTAIHQSLTSKDLIVLIREEIYSDPTIPPQMAEDGILTTKSSFPRIGE